MWWNQTVKTWFHFKIIITKQRSKCHHNLTTNKCQSWSFLHRSDYLLYKLEQWPPFSCSLDSNYAIWSENGLLAPVTVSKDILMIMLWLLSDHQNFPNLIIISPASPFKLSNVDTVSVKQWLCTKSSTWLNIFVYKIFRFLFYVWSSCW